MTINVKIGQSKLSILPFELGVLFLRSI